MFGRFTLTLVAALSAAPAAFANPATSTWDPAQKLDELAGNSSEVNTPSLDGCPILSPDGRSIFFASNRPGGHGGLDIWFATREGVGAPFGAPRTLPPPINSPANDFCPTPLRNGRLLFVSNRTITGVTCGMGDLYLARHEPSRGWVDAHHLACAPNGPNSSLDEQGPSLIDAGGVRQLFFSRSAPDVKGDLFVSRGFGSAIPVSELNQSGNDIQPNVRPDGLELVFSSDHAHPGAQGGQDIYTATRASVEDPWSAPVNLGPAVNTAAGETRPSLSWDAGTLLFGRAPGPEGAADIFQSARLAVRTPCSRRQSLRVLLRRGGCTTTAVAPRAGTLTVTWRRGTVVLASGRVAVRTAGQVTVRLRPNGRGSRRLARARAITLRATATLRTPGRPASVASSDFILRR